MCGDGIVDPGELCDDMNAIADDGCTNCQPDGTSCAAAIAVTLTPGSVTLVDDTTGGGHSGRFGNAVHPFCGPGGEDAPDRVYVLVPPSDGFLTYALDPGSPNTVRVRNNCGLTTGGAYHMCGLSGGIRVLGGQTYYLEVDSTEGTPGPFPPATLPTTGPYTLHVHFAHGTCASPIILPLDIGVGGWFDGYSAAGANNGYLPDCNNAGLFSNELVFELQPPVAGTVNISMFNPSYAGMVGLRCLYPVPEPNANGCYANLTTFQNLSLGHSFGANEKRYMHWEGAGQSTGGTTRFSYGLHP